MATGEQLSPPKIADAAGWARFRSLATEMGLNPDDPWVGGYVPYEWDHARHFFEAYAHDIQGRRVLEFGCNVGASGIVLANLGADVVGVEVDAKFASLAQAQAEAYGFASRVKILQLDDTRRMPFPDGHFHLIVCNSVLEYVSADSLAAVQQELMRVLAPGGLILVMGTSNRLWPREVHSGRWLFNYLPRFFDKFLGGEPRQRGVSPFTVRNGFRNCVLVDKEDGSAAYLSARERMGTGARGIAIMRAAATLLTPFPMTVGMLTPSFAMALRRQV